MQKKSEVEKKTDTYSFTQFILEAKCIFIIRWGLHLAGGNSVQDADVDFYKRLGGPSYF